MNNTIQQEQEVRNLTISDYLRILYRGRWVILFSFLVVFMATVYYTFTATPVYEATSSIILDRSNMMEQTLFDFNTFSNQNTQIANQMEIIKSRTLAERVIRRLELSDVRDSLSLFQPNDDGEFKTLRDMTKVIADRMEVVNKKDTDIIEVHFSAPTPFEAAYIANTIVQEYQNSSMEFNRSEITDLRNFLDEQVRKKHEDLKQSEDLLRDYQEKERVASLDEETTELVTRLSDVEAQLEQARVELDGNQEMRNSLQSQIDDQRKNLSSEITEISTPYLKSLQEQLAAQVAERTKYLIALESEGTNVNKSYFQGQVQDYDNTIAALKEKLADEAKKISSSSMVSDHFQLSQDLVTKLLGIEAEIKALQAKITALQDVVNEYNNELESLPVKVLELARLKRREMVDEQTYLMMVKKLEETKIQEAGQSKSVRPVDEALEPLEPVSPKKKLNLALGLVLGLGLGVGLTFLREFMDNSIKTQEELEGLGYNILATIPKIEMGKLEQKLENRLSKLGPIEGKRIEARLITHLDPKSPVSEAYRTFRTNLQFSKIDKKLSTLLITSSGPKEGKSTTSANLAIAVAQSGKKVVLIDADLRRPVVHSIFGLDKDDGITNYLMNDISYEKMIKRSFMNNLFLVPSGALPPNPSELLSSQKMEELIQSLKQNFDLVIFDTPPIIAVTDAAILSTKVDGTVLVVSAGQTNQDAVVRAKSLLDNVNARILGALLNGVEVGGMYGTYYYYYYHNYYSKPGKKNRRRAY